MEYASFVAVVVSFFAPVLALISVWNVMRRQDDLSAERVVQGSLHAIIAQLNNLQKLNFVNPSYVDLNVSSNTKSFYDFLTDYISIGNNQRIVRRVEDVFRKVIAACTCEDDQFASRENPKDFDSFLTKLKECYDEVAVYYHQGTSASTRALSELYRYISALSLIRVELDNTFKKKRDGIFDFTSRGLSFLLILVIMAGILVWGYYFLPKPNRCENQCASSTAVQGAVRTTGGYLAQS